MNEILKQLKQWREDRNITESIKNDYKANMFEELSEYCRAKDDNERIDALCDMAIFTINHAELNNVDNDTPIGEREYPGIYYVRDVPILLSVAEALSDKIIIASYDVENLPKKSLVDIFLACWKTADLFGYNFEKCMLETIKEISSRRQDPKQFAQWVENGASGKWLKDKNQDTDTLYKADYEKCKL